VSAGDGMTPLTKRNRQHPGLGNRGKREALAALSLSRPASFAATEIAKGKKNITGKGSPSSHSAIYYRSERGPDEKKKKKRSRRKDYWKPQKDGSQRGEKLKGGSATQLKAGLGLKKKGRRHATKSELDSALPGPVSTLSLIGEQKDETEKGGSRLDGTR